MPAQLFAHRQAVVEAGHHDVQHRHVEALRVLGVELQGLVAGLRLYGEVAGTLQVDDHEFPDVLFILCH